MVKDIAELFDAQAQQQQLWYKTARLTPERRAELTKELSLGIYEELAELIRQVDRSRYHILQPQPGIDPDQVAHDAVEVFKMLLALAHLHGVTAEMFAEQFDRVTRVVEDKYRGQKLKLEEEVNVILCDLDGCAADWTSTFREFCGQRGVDFGDGGQNHPSLEPLKDEFDRSGGYLLIKPLPGAVETLKRLKAMGYKLIIVTARPYERFKRVYGDTIEWCEKSGIKYDRIMFKRDKAEAVRAVAPARVVAFIEDRAKHAIEVALTGVKVLKMPCESFEQVSHENIIEVNGWGGIFAYIKQHGPLKER